MGLKLNPDYKNYELIDTMSKQKLFIQDFTSSNHGPMNKKINIVIAMVNKFLSEFPNIDVIQMTSSTSIEKGFFRNRYIFSIQLLYKQ